MVEFRHPRTETVTLTIQAARERYTQSLIHDLNPSHTHLTS
jgi:hypothetical protein